MTDYKQPVYVLDASTREVVDQYATVKAFRAATGWGAGKTYRLINTPVSQQKKSFLKDRYVYLSQKATGNVLVKADPDQEYIVHDGEQVYHKGPLAECRMMQSQLGFPTLKIKLWKQQQ